MSEQGNGKPLEIGISVDRATAEEALRILNWYFDERPDDSSISDKAKRTGRKRGIKP